MSDDEQRDAAPARKKRSRHRNDGLRKLCDHPRRNWPKCPDSWYFNFKPRGGRAFMFSLDKELGQHIATKEDAKKEADRIRSEIRAGTFVRATERAKIATAATATTASVSLDAFAAIYLERVSQVRQRNKSWTNDRHMFAQLGAFRLTHVGGSAKRRLPLSLRTISKPSSPTFVSGVGQHRPETATFNS
jgi:hypothetical protein